MTQIAEHDTIRPRTDGLLAHKVIVITGASSGIGALAARLFARVHSQPVAPEENHLIQRVEYRVFGGGD